MHSYILLALTLQWPMLDAHTVTIPLPAPAIMVAVAPPIFSGHASLSLSFSAPNVVNRTALFAPCLQSTGVKPLHKESTPSCRVVCATSCGTESRPKWPPDAASCITRVFNASAGVTTRALSIAPAHRPDMRLSQGFCAADLLLMVGEEK